MLATIFVLTEMKARVGRTRTVTCLPQIRTRDFGEEKVYFKWGSKSPAGFC